MAILIVDDSQSHLTLMKTILNLNGFQNLYMADSALAGIDILKEKTSEIDLILMDFMMPEVDGIQACRMIKSRPEFKDIPIIIVTADATPESLKRAFAAGAIDFISKPMNKVEMLARIRSVLSLKMEMDERKNKEKELLKVNQDLLEAINHIRKDIEAASIIQQKVLPQPDTKIPGVSLGWKYIPCEILGGDIFNIFLLDEGIVCYYILDVSGHGVQAALLSVALSKMLYSFTVNRNNADFYKYPEHKTLAKIVSELNHAFQTDFESNQYFTLIYGIIDLNKNEMSYIHAGHQPLLILDRNGLHSLNSLDIPVGWFDDYEFTQNTVKLLPESRLLLYSDGVVEAKQPTTRELFGFDTVEDLMKDNPKLSPQETVDLIADKVYVWIEGNKLSDDLTMLFIEMNKKEEKDD